jgi:hypothetical protein
VPKLSQKKAAPPVEKPTTELLTLQEEDRALKTRIRELETRLDEIVKMASRA